MMDADDHRVDQGVAAGDQPPAHCLEGIHIAVVEDDAELREVIADELRHEGAQVVGFGSAAGLYRHLLVQACDIVLLDVGLPGEDGYSIAGYLREVSPATGIVMLTGRGTVPDMTRGLRQGADLYLVKPLDIALLVAALDSLLRRVRAHAPSAPPAVQPVVAEDWKLGDDGWTLVCPGQRTLALTDGERTVLGALFAQRGKTVGRDALIACLTQAPWDFDPHRLQVLVYRLRARVAAVSSQPFPLHAVRGQGYRLGLAPEEG